MAKTPPSRRTFADIGKLSVEEVTAALVERNITPIEFFLVDDEAFLLHTMPKIEPWQKWDMSEFATRASDPFVADYNSRFPQDDLPTTLRKQLFESDLKVFVDGLSRQQLMAQLKVLTVEAQRTPEPSWTAEDFRREMTSRIRQLETAAPTTKPKRRT